MKYKYEIHQIKNPKCNYRFLWWDQAKKDFDFSDYEKVYESEINGERENIVLETLFEIFNLYRPEDFKGHSLSVSDIIKLDDKYYYCDNSGWEDITKYISNK